MPQRNEPRCETCGNYKQHEHNEYTGTCCLDGQIVDEKETCWWHTDKGNKKDKEEGEPL